MKQSKAQLYEELAACARCVETAVETTAWQEPDKLKALALDAENHQRTLYVKLQAQFITPMERGDLYLPSCQCLRQLRLLAGTPPGFAESPYLRQCAKEQLTLLRQLPSYTQPVALHVQCGALRRSVAKARTARPPARVSDGILDSFCEMADLIDYLLLKNN